MESISPDVTNQMAIPTIERRKIRRPMRTVLRGVGLFALFTAVFVLLNIFGDVAKAPITRIIAVISSIIILLYIVVYSFKRTSNNP